MVDHEGILGLHSKGERGDRPSLFVVMVVVRERNGRKNRWINE